MKEEVVEHVKTLEPIIDFSKLQKGEKIFNIETLKVEYIDTFDHIEHWDDGRDVVFYYNHFGQYFNGLAKPGYWYYSR